MTKPDAVIFCHDFRAYLCLAQWAETPLDAIVALQGAGGDDPDELEQVRTALEAYLASLDLSLDDPATRMILGDPKDIHEDRPFLALFTPKDSPAGTAPLLARDFRPLGGTMLAGPELLEIHDAAAIAQLAAARPDATQPDIDASGAEPVKAFVVFSSRDEAGFAGGGAQNFGAAQNDG